jgi:hypothetical protein
LRIVFSPLDVGHRIKKLHNGAYGRIKMVAILDIVRHLHYGLVRFFRELAYGTLQRGGAAIKCRDIFYLIHPFCRQAPHSV